MTKKRFLFLELECGSVSASDRRNMVRYQASLFVWALIYLGCTFVIARELVTGGPLGWILAVLPSLVAVVAVLAFVRYLRDADEMQRLIELQALALAVFAGFVVWPALELLKLLEVPVEEVGEFLPMAMIVAYVVGNVASRRRFR